ncbi:MAG: aminoacyl-tRNA hydrolase [Alphaproteobacteria bacterium]|nr:aminoacyl-tRNA hydrolase [Alphaproteobacteria bacterium]
MLKTAIYLIVGLGNPGIQYSKTIHNIGFMFVDYLASSIGFPEYKQDKKFNALYTEKIINGNKFIIIKPQTFMNLSGQAVQQFVSFYKIKPENVFVVHDDIDIKPSKIKVKLGGSSGGHNGIKNIDLMLGTNNYWRIRIGVGRPENKDIQINNYVLSNVPEVQMEKNEKIFEVISNNIEELATSDNKQQVVNNITLQVSELSKTIK